MRIEQAVINDIKDKTDILDLVSEYVKLEKEGETILVYALSTMKKHHRSPFQKINKFVIVSVVKRW